MDRVKNFERYTFGGNVPELPRQLLDPRGSHKGTNKQGVPYPPIARDGLQFVAICLDYGGYSFKNCENEKLHLLPMNHPKVIQHFDKNKELYPQIIIYEVPKCLLPYLYIESYDGAENLRLDVTAMERDIALEEIKNLKVELAKLRNR